MKLYFEVNKPIEKVFKILSDLSKFAKYHPVISKIEHVESNNFIVFETLKFIFIPISFTYPVKLDLFPSENKISMKANVMKVVKITMIFTLSWVNNKTKIEENIKFDSYLPVKFILKAIFSKQHKQLFKNIENFERHFFI